MRKVLHNGRILLYVGIPSKEDKSNRTNTLAYLVVVSVSKIKRFVTFNRAQCYKLYTP